MQRVLDGAGPHAARIAELWWLTLAICVAVFIAVFAAFLFALWRGRRNSAFHGTFNEGKARTVVALAVAASTAGLLFLIAASVLTDRALASYSAQDPVRIRITGSQWWWQARYEDPVPSRMFTTANEIHIPVGRPVTLILESGDVIHSFWVPSLHGKMDLIPGRTSVFQIRADKAGTYRGQCAEFCGHQHAKMAFLVVAQAPKDYEAWAEAQRAAPPPPADDVQRRGQDLFVRGRCAMCHTVTGTQANGRLGPDLTHLASRQTLAAGALPNTRQHLAAWISDPQVIKPGARMPPNRFSVADLDALLAYLGTLK